MIIPRFVMSAILVLALVPLTVFAQNEQNTGRHQPYRGFEKRDIKSLSQQDIDALRQGRGWGLALPAELNGHPGPLHVLELRKELRLSSAQEQAITAQFEDMRADAIRAGERFISAEAALSKAFEGGDVTEDKLRALLAESAEARAALRFVHLSRHLSTSTLLSEDQVARYNELRGYADDPCLRVPDGHNAEMWRRHNGCDE